MRRAINAAIIQNNKILVCRKKDMDSSWGKTRRDGK